MIHRVVLVYPASRRYSGFLSTHRLPGLVTAHAGLTIMAQILQARGLSVRVLDEQITPFDDTHLEGVDLLGVSVQTSWAPQAYRIARRARRAGVPVVLGGVHATLNPDEAMLHADYVVRGEGEHALMELIDALGSGAELSSVRGLSFKEAGVVRHNPDRPPLSNEALDTLPFPRLDLIEGYTDYRRFPLNAVIYSTMLTRGCDQACTYCSITRVFGRALRHRSVGNILEELGSRFDPRRQFLFLMDDSLAVDRDFLKSFLEAMLRERLVPRLGWHSQLRADVADDRELLDLMRRTNCTFVTCGFESVNARSLKSLGKGQSPQDVARAIARLREHNIVVNGFFMFGTDHDGPESFGETVSFARRSGCTLAGFMPLTPFPGTPTFEQLDREGRIFTKDWELYDVQHAVFTPRHLSPWELHWRTLACYPAFYTSMNVREQARLVLAKRPSPAMIAIAATWPFIKQLCWAREVAANLDYLVALGQYSHNNIHTFPDLGSRRLWAKDLVSGRALRRRRRAATAG